MKNLSFTDDVFNIISASVCDGHRNAAVWMTNEFLRPEQPVTMTHEDGAEALAQDLQTSLEEVAALSRRRGYSNVAEWIEEAMNSVSWPVRLQRAVAMQSA